MWIGETLLTNDSMSGVTYYTPWFPREGNGATFVCEVLQTGDVETLQVTVETKNADEDDSAAVAVGTAASITLTADTRTAFERGGGLAGAGFKELVRLKYTVVQSSVEGAPLGFVHCRMQNPSWLAD